MNHNQYYGHPFTQQWQNHGQNGHHHRHERHGHYHHPHTQSQGSHMHDWQRRISIIEAINIAVEQVPGQVVQAELEHEKGMLVYEVDIVTAQGVKYEVIVDADNGTVLEVKLD